MSPTPSLLLKMVEQNDEKHEEGHKRLRRDLTEGLDELGARIDHLNTRQQRDHDLLIKQVTTGERRREMSAHRAVILAAVVSGSFRVAEVVCVQLLDLFQRLLN